MCCKFGSPFTLYFYRPQTKFAKVMFLHLSVSHSVHSWGGVGGVCTSACWDAHPFGTRGRHAPGSSARWEIRATSLRYASYWNAYLLFRSFTLICDCQIYKGTPYVCLLGSVYWQLARVDILIGTGFVYIFKCPCSRHLHFLRGFETGVMQSI